VDLDGTDAGVNGATGVQGSKGKLVLLDLTVQMVLTVQLEYWNPKGDVRSCWNLV
jgi:hypothetical protein